MAFAGGLAVWLDGRVSIPTEMEDSKKLRHLEQVGFPVMCMEESVRMKAQAARVLQAELSGQVSWNH